MYRVVKDIPNNRLNIKMNGIISVSEAKGIKSAIEKEIESLKPGFDVIDDISEFIRGQDEAGALLQETMKYLIQKNVGRIVRVVGTSKTGLIQFANFSLPISSYNLKYVPTLADAEKYLNDSD